MNYTANRFALVGILLVMASLRNPDYAQDLNSRPGATTQPAISVTIKCDATELKRGDEIPITFVIKNEGKVPFKYIDRDYDRSGRMDEYKLSAIGEDGKAIPDPRATLRARIGGGIANAGNLEPGQSFSKTVSLNRWALVTMAGKYRVIGTYFPTTPGSAVHGDKSGVESAPIEIDVQPRTDEEMDEYIKGLATKFTATAAENDEVLQRLAFSCDPRIVPILIHELYQVEPGNTQFWAEEAIDYYLPKDQRTTDLLVNAVAERGMPIGMFIVLLRSGCTHEQIKTLIEISLSSDHPDGWQEGARAAQINTDDAFTPRLIAIAKESRSNARWEAIYALAFNRTDESVTALKLFLNDPATKEKTADAIRTAYLGRGITDGRKLRPDDFGPEYRQLQLPK